MFRDETENHVPAAQILDLGGVLSKSSSIGPVAPWMHGQRANCGIGVPPTPALLLKIERGYCGVGGRPPTPPSREEFHTSGRDGGGVLSLTHAKCQKTATDFSSRAPNDAVLLRSRIAVFSEGRGLAGERHVGAEHARGGMHHGAAATAFATVRTCAAQASLACIGPNGRGISRDRSEPEESEPVADPPRRAGNGSLEAP